MINAYSIAGAVLFFNLSLVLIYFLRRNSVFLVAYSISGLLLLLALAIFRLLLPLCFENAIVIQSRSFLPAIRDAVTMPVFRDAWWLSLGRLLLLLWGVGAVSYAVIDIVNLCSFRRAAANYIPSKNDRAIRLARELGIRHRVVVTSDICVAYVDGVFRHVIYIPDVEYTDRELKIILLHENQHVKNRDSLIKLAFLIIEELFWWNPVVHIFQKELDALLELRCDRSITRNMNKEQRCEYLSTMLSAIKFANPGICLSSTSSAIIGSEHDMKQRFQMIVTNNERKSKRHRILIYSLITAFFISSYAFVIEPISYRGSEIKGSRPRYNFSCVDYSFPRSPR